MPSYKAVTMTGPGFVYEAPVNQHCKNAAVIYHLLGTYWMSRYHWGY